jgi:hypothetical protein
MLAWMLTPVDFYTNIRPDTKPLPVKDTYLSNDED